MSGEGLARQPRYPEDDDQDILTHPDLSLVPTPGQELEEVDFDAVPLDDFRTDFSIPRSIPRGYAKTRHERVDPDREPSMAEGKVNGLQIVLDESANHPLLTPDQEIDLAQRIERGDLEAKEEMFNSNLRLVVYNARRYQGQGLAFGDLIQEGMIGLMRATEKFDYRKGFRFSTYATLWIRQSIQRGLENSSRTIRLPVHVAQRARKVERVTRQLTAKLGHEPSDEEVAEEAQMELGDVIEVRAAERKVISLDKPIGEDGDADLGDMFASSESDPFDEAVDALQSETLLNAISELPDNERKVLEMRFGAGDMQPHTLSQAGRELGVSTERARQIEERALKRLSQRPELIAIRDADKWEAPEHELNEIEDHGRKLGLYRD